MNEHRATLRIGVLAVAVFLLSIVVVVNYGSQLEKINWRLVSLVCVIGVVLFVLYRWNKAPLSQSRYEAQKLVMTNGEADLWKHLVLFFAGLSAWVIIQKMLVDPQGDITALMTIVLGVFVSKEILGAFAEAIKSRPAATPAAGPAINITAAAAEQPKPAQPTADLETAGRGVEPMPATIGLEDVGKKTALASKRNQKAAP